MQNYSMLDLAPVPENSNISDALSNTLDLAIYAEECGYHRYWLAEHHNMPGIASAATSVVISRVASKTNTIRVGAGGVMLPNHSPLVIAEQFGTLESFFPNRIDLGLGRAPGGDQITARALRKKIDNNQDFPSDVLELISYLSDTPNNNGVTAIPGIGTNVPVWILGSSLYGAELAAHFGLPYAFASHFSPTLLGKALHVYRSTFNPSKWANKPPPRRPKNVASPRIPCVVPMRRASSIRPKSPPSRTLSTYTATPTQTSKTHFRLPSMHQDQV